jgi:hypothetical protein
MVKSIENLELSTTAPHLIDGSVNGSCTSIPDGAFVREEFIKCGKISCFTCPHGPYYYAYWKDNHGKLKKKYLGTNKPTVA